MMRVAFCVVMIFVLQAAGLAADVAVEKTKEGAAVKIDGELFTEYLTKSGNKPVLWPIVAAGGVQVTRGYPIAPRPGETNDHIHQRGLWFTHGDVNGVNFWMQQGVCGETRHREFVKLEGGDTGTIVTRNDWLDPQGKKVGEDERTFRFSADDDVRIIDVELAIRATEGDLKFGDNKEGAFALRIADSMRVDAKQGGKLINSHGASNESAWGQPANWVDYYGPVDGRIVGVAIFDHPSNPGHPVRWHVRTYGLFSANPFGRKAFDPAQTPMEFVIPKGDSATFKYRLIIHHGDEKEGKIAERWEAYAK